MDCRDLEERFAAHLGRERRPVAVAYAAAPPERVTRFEGTVPSGCSFWRLAAAGRTFYTVAADHRNCAVGAYTHNLPVAQESLQQTLGMMLELKYLREQEIPGVHRLDRTPQVVVYAPLADSPVDPDVVVFSGRPGRLMLLVEAAQRAGVYAGLPLLPRPTCMALPAALAHGVVVSGGCAGNRVYTGLGDDELYAVAPRRDLERMAAELAVIAAANARLAEYHRARAAQ